MFRFSLLALLLSSPCLFAIDGQSNFSTSYKKANSGSWDVEVPEVRELVNIIFAIHPDGIAGRPLGLHRLFYKNDPEYKSYYKSVLKHFLPYYSHPAVAKVGSVLAKPDKWHSYPYLNLNSYAFKFSKGKIIPTGEHISLWSKDKNWMKEYIPLLEDFAKKSDFLRFYKKHEPFYKRLKRRYKKAVDVKRQKRWLEKRFDGKVDSYKILISPLVYGFHCAGQNESNGFKEILMSISAPDEGVESFKLERVVFTEIDHNYVNPLSDKFKDQIEKSVKPEKWANSDVRKSYSSALSIFNEYMTWGVFLLYARDTFPEKQQKEIRTSVYDKMKNQRGFTRFPEFGDYLLSKYKKKSSKPIESLYPAVITWMNTQKDQN